MRTGQLSAVDCSMETVKKKSLSTRLAVSIRNDVGHNKPRGSGELAADAYLKNVGHATSSVVSVQYNHHQSLQDEACNTSRSHYQVGPKNAIGSTS